jgi:putative restriction endonuclease
MIDIAEVERHLKSRGYVVVHETEKKRGYQLGKELPLYLNLTSKSGVTALVAHPASTVSELRGSIEGLTVATDYFHSSNLKLFPKRKNNGKSEIEYGWGLTFDSEVALTHFLDAISIAPIIISAERPAVPASSSALVLDPEDTSETPEMPTMLPGQDGTTLSTYRIGHDNFRQVLVDYWGSCAVTRLGALQLLRASHIKPWAASSPIEKTDPFNGLLLAPHLDAAFDVGLIGFRQDGTLIRSRRLSPADVEALGLVGDLRLRRTDARHIPFLDYHRQTVFVD